MRSNQDFGIGAEAVGPGQPGAQMPHAEPLQPEHRVIEPVIVEMKPLADSEIGRVVGETGWRRASACRPRAPGPYRNAGSRKSPRPPCDASSPARPAADRTGCTSGCAAPGRSSSSAVRLRPNSCTSSAPKLEAPHSETQIGRSVTASISASFSGQASIGHKFQSSGKPCTAMTSSAVERALCLHVGDEIRVDRRDAAENPGQARRLGRDRLAGQPAHARKPRPVRVELGVPMRLVVRLVPDHRGFDHAATPLTPRGGNAG